MASVTNGLTNLKDVLGNPLVRAIERAIDDQCFMLGAIDQASNRLPAGVKAELGRMIDFFDCAIKPAAAPAARPVYNPDGLMIAMQAAAQGFRRPWAGRLGLGSHENAYKEHWTRIKALNRRIAGEFGNEYDTLRPVADLLARLSEEVSRYLDYPFSWEPRDPDDEAMDAALSEIRQQVYTELHSLAERRLVQNHLTDWRNAYDRRGKGSTLDRALGINSIYANGAPVVSTVMTATTAEFVHEMRLLVHRAILENGGRLQAQTEV